MTGTARPTAPQKGRPIDLDAAMKAKMENAFGDLSAVKLYESPTVGQAGAEAMAMGNEVAFAPGMADFSSRAGQERLGHELSHVMSQRSGAVRGEGFLASASLEARADREGAMAAAGEQVYSGPVTAALSAAGPVPAAAGPMQAKRDRFGGGKEKTKNTPQPELIQDPGPRSEYADDIDLLNSQAGTKKVRKQAYDNIAVPTANRMTEDQRHAVSEYIAASSGYNAYLREQKDSIHYPKSEEELQRTQKEVNDISQAIRNNSLPEKLTTYRGTTDNFLAVLLKQNDLGMAVKDDGSVNHQWLNKHQKILRKKLIGKTFHEKAFTSTSTEKSFAQEWSRDSSKHELMMSYYDKGNLDEATKIQDLARKHPEQIPGAHLLTMNLPKGAKGAFVDRTTDGSAKAGNDQHEVLLDKGSFFKISDIRKMKDSDSYELVMDLLAEEEGRKK